MRCLSLLCLLCCASLAPATSLCEEVKLALADARKLPREEAHYYRYLSTYNLAEAERELHLKIVLLFHANSLSQEPELARPVQVGPTLWRIKLTEYGEPFALAYENLHRANPYFPCFERIQVIPVVPAKAVPALSPRVSQAGEELRRALLGPESPQQPSGQQVWVFRNGFVQVALEQVKDGEKVYRKLDERSWQEIPRPPPPATAPPPAVKAELVEARDIKIAAFLPAPELAELATILGTRAPLVRVDWFFYRSAISLNRAGDGYYDFLGVKNRDDAYKLAGLDLKQIARLRADMAAMIAESDVAVNRNRQVWWVKTYAGSWWQTFDIDSDPVKKKNLLRLLGTALDRVDFDHQAEEIYFTSPNGLWFLLACNNQGVLQQTVPDSIASDDQTTSKDARIHVGMSCYRCHAEGLRPLEDWGRETYRQAEDAVKTGQVLLGSPDPKKLARLKQLYLSDLPDRLETDQLAYAKRLKKLNGLTPQQVASGVRQVWRRYADTPLYLADVARELGTTPEFWEKALSRHVAGRSARGELADPLLAGLLPRKGRKAKRLLRPQLEELFPVMQAILKEGNP